MNPEQQRKINEQVSSKASAMTEDDMNNIVSKKEKVFSLFKKIGAHAEEFKLCWNLLVDYKNGSYKNVPWKLIAGIVFAFVYFVSPLDVIPDVIPVLGFTDDISVLGLVLAGFAKELEQYKDWKELHSNSQNEKQIEQ